MTSENFLVIMPNIITDLVNMIKQNIDEKEAIQKLYNSKLYAFLEDEQTKGNIQFPDV